jgi:hypothetical protein
MTTLFELAADLRQTHAAIRHMEELIAARPDDDALELNMLAIQKRQRVLEREFAELANLKHVDVLSYRFIPETGTAYPLSAVAGALSALQEAVTIVFDALKTVPKIKARISPDIAAATTLDFAYSYDGSLGFAFSIPNERLLLIESDLDMAISLVFRAMKATTRDEIVNLAKEIGPAGLRRIYKWSEHHSQYDIGAGIEWRRRQEVREEVRVQPAALIRLQELIKESSPETIEDIAIDGVLMGIDVTADNFRLAVAEGDDVRGRLAEEFDRSQHWAVVTRYSAVIEVRTKISYATDTELKSFYLKQLRPLIQTE